MGSSQLAGWGCPGPRLPRTPSVWQEGSHQRRTPVTTLSHKSSCGLPSCLSSPRDREEARSLQPPAAGRASRVGPDEAPMRPSPRTPLPAQARHLPSPQPLPEADHQAPCPQACPQARGRLGPHPGLSTVTKARDHGRHQETQPWQLRPGRRGPAERQPCTVTAWGHPGSPPAGLGLGPSGLRGDSSPRGKQKVLGLATTSRPSVKVKVKSLSRV